MKSLLPLTSALSGVSESSRFVAIKTDTPDGGQFLFSLTPRVMRWSSDTYLLDLEPVCRYWSDLAKMRGVSFIEYISALVSELTSTHTQATLAPHPWQAILLLSAIDGRPSLSFIDAKSYLGRKSLQEVTWNNWIARCHELREHLLAHSSKKPSKDSLGSLTTLAKTINRLQFKHVAQMSDIDSGSMQRRFGKLAATAWRWTWQSKTTEQLHQKTLFDEPFTDDFPWINLTSKDVPTVSRHLDTPLREWDHMAPLLCEDLDKLCNLTCWSTHERVVSLEWELSFSCSPSLRIPVLFRHPHPLHHESGHHKTALLQAFHSWQKAISNKDKPECTGDLFITDDSITEWSVTIRERLSFTPGFRSIFAEDLAKDSSKLQQLENTLAVPLVDFLPTDHWTPEYSYGPRNDAPTQDSLKTNLLPNISRLATNQRRPLFIYTNSEPLAERHQSSGLIFSERVTTAWWAKASNPEENCCRDYYIRITDDGLLQWVFPNDDGSLRIHGIFG